MRRRVGCGLGVLLALGLGAAACLLLATVAVVAVPEVGLAVARSHETRAPADAAPMTHGRFVEGPDGQLYVQVHGKGPTVVLVHGSAAWSGTWRDTQAVLADAGFQVVAVDLPPFGYSARPEGGPYDREAQAERLVAVLDALRIRKAAWVGHSFGGGPTLEVALRHPERVWGLALVDVALALDEPDSVDFVDRLLSVGRVRQWMVAATFTNQAATQTVLEQFIADPADATADRVALYQQPLHVEGTTAAIADWLPELWSPRRDVMSMDPDTFSRLPVPVAVLWGTADTVTPLEQGEALVARLPKGRLIELEGLGHIPHIEDVGLFHEALLPYLERRRRFLQGDRR